jgi:ribosomal protein S18 acetylase RimI-like enzyme
LTPADYDALVELWKQAGLEYRPNGRDSKLSIVIQMSMDPELFLGAFEDGRLIGSLIATFDGRRGWINRLATVPEERRKGVAKALIARAEKLLRQRGAMIIGAHVERENTASLRLFENSGYSPRGDIVYMSKRDRPDV